MLVRLRMWSADISKEAEAALGEDVGWVMLLGIKFTMQLSRSDIVRSDWGDDNDEGGKESKDM